MPYSIRAWIFAATLLLAAGAPAYSQGAQRRTPATGLPMEVHLRVSNASLSDQPWRYTFPFTYRSKPMCYGGRVRLAQSAVTSTGTLTQQSTIGRFLCWPNTR